MKKSDIYIAIEKFEKAIASLREGVNQTNTDLERDGTIQRFEYTVELLWKTLKIILTYYGVECNNPRTCIKEAFRNNLIDDDEILLDMLEDRNLSSHIYDEDTSKEIFERIKNIYINILERVVQMVKSNIK
ncbi:MAG TPA: nucleotidyltransferase substrate binding protein [Spirochaetota bacterium]|nr:nucleotidyltransferase substrate binding protein [Spirochaetota bacterium]HOM10832.1 nucleotidyltransferase substrate binding protein [Spirochaetota bacterium]HPP50714.1 nucleotidyltransferase substrate binding protein [Spirochaetota bacterium]